MIKILNKRHGNESHLNREYVGRPSVLGNPFSAKQHGGREQAILLYRRWLGLQWTSGNKKVKDELIRLANKYEIDSHLELECWCAPKPCHANVIAEAIEAIIKRGDHKPEEYK